MFFFLLSLFFIHTTPIVNPSILPSTSYKIRKCHHSLVCGLREIRGLRGVGAHGDSRNPKYGDLLQGQFTWFPALS